MPRPPSPSMPTEKQIADTYKAVCKLHPDARIARVGPEGVTFEYPSHAAEECIWNGKPFTAGKP